MEKLPVIKEVKHRVPSFDILRVFLLLLVVNIHREHFTGAEALLPNRFGWYAVPTFIVLSFYLTSNFYLQHNPAISSLVKRIKRFFVPFLFWSIVGFLVTPSAFNIQNLFTQLFTGGVINVPLYYLLIMAIFTVIFWALTFIPIRARVITMMVLTFGMLYLQYSGINYNFFSSVEPAILYCYGRIAELFPFAVTGILLGRLVTNGATTKHIMLITGLFGGLYFAAQTTKQPQDVDYGGTLLYFGATFIFLYFLLVRHLRFPEKFEQKISVLGAYSFGIYVSHYIFFELLKMYFPTYKEWNTAAPVGFLLGFIAACYAVIIGVDKLTRGRFSYLFK